MEIRAEPVKDPRKSPLPPETRIGHVHLKVAEIDRAVHFYRDILGFDIVARVGNQAAFLSAGGYHHHIAVNTFESAGGEPPPPGRTGLYHLAILYPTRLALSEALRRLLDNGWPVTGASDHGVSQAIYLDDPDANGVELCWDLPRDEWPRDENGEIVMYLRPLDVDGLLAESAQD